MTSLQTHGSIKVIRYEGPLRAENLDDLNEDFRDKLTAGVPQVIIDLSETPLIDGAGLEWILDLDDECSRKGGCVLICGIGELCRDLLRITGVGNRVQQFPDLTTALGSFA